MLTVLPCACHFQPAHQHFSCYKWQAVILKARHDAECKIYHRHGVSAPGGRILSMSTVKLLPNKACQEETEHPGPLCALPGRPLGSSEHWMQKQALPRTLGCAALPRTLGCAVFKFCWLGRDGEWQGLTGCQICPAWPRPSKERSRRPPVSFLSSLRPE